MKVEDDGRIEVSCAVCGGHMGHIFDGTGEKGRYQQRHCVNDSSIQYLKYSPPDGIEEEGKMALPMDDSEPVISTESLADSDTRYFHNGKPSDASVFGPV